MLMNKNSAHKEVGKKNDRKKKDNADNDTRRKVDNKKLSDAVDIINPDINSMDSRG